MPVQVLVVDDDPSIRAVIVMSLQDEGYTVAIAVDGRAAVHQVQADPPALVLLDLNMPGMSGWEVLLRLRQAGSTPPVVFMTAAHSAQQEADRHGADGYLSKPFALTALSAVVARFAAPAPEVS